MKTVILKIFLLIILSASVPSVLFYGCSGDSKETAGENIYYCPMHPEVQSDKPGVCPICHMDLVLKDNSGDDMAEHTDDVLSLNERKLALAGVSVSEIKTEDLVKEISAYSYIDFAEQNRKIITAKFSGRIEKLYADKTGEYISKGQVLFEIYSPDLIQAQNDFLIASKNLSSSGIPGGNSLKESAQQKLLIMGITNDQINELQQSGKVPMTIKYHSPASGTVIEKKVQEGMYVNEGSIIYDIADLSELWVISEVFMDDIALIGKNHEVKLRLQSYPDKEFTGKVDLVYPVINPETRTVKVRSVFSNRNNLLKPNMFGNAGFSIKLKKGVVVPAGAVIQTGKRSIVWVQKEKGKFEMREIKTGYRVNNKLQVLAGLKEGELVASEGSYLIDSEGQLKGGTTTGEHLQHQTERPGNNLNDNKADNKLHSH